MTNNGITFRFLLLTPTLNDLSLQKRNDLMFYLLKLDLKFYDFNFIPLFEYSKYYFTK